MRAKMVKKVLMLKLMRNDKKFVTLLGKFYVHVR